MSKSSKGWSSVTVMCPECGVHVNLRTNECACDDEEAKLALMAMQSFDAAERADMVEFGK